MDTEPMNSALAHIDHQRMMQAMTTVIAEDSFVYSPDYHCAVEEWGDPEVMVSVLSDDIAAAERAWKKQYGSDLTVTFPEWFVLTDITDKYPEPQWPTVQEIWDELWPPAEEPEPAPVVVMAELLAAHPDATPAEATLIVEAAATMPALPAPVEPLALSAGPDTQQMAPVAQEDAEPAGGVRDEMVQRAEEQDPVTLTAEAIRTAITEHYGPETLEESPQGEKEEGSA